MTSKPTCYLIALLLFQGSSWLHSQTPGANDADAVLYTNCVLHTAAGEAFEQGALGVINGTIHYAGRAIAAPKQGYDRVVDLQGKHVYPALISTNTTLGINEISAVRATRDFAETGRMNPNVRAISAYNAESDVAATVLSNGILFAQVTPQGGTLSGTSSVVVLQGWNWEDAAYRTDEGLHLHWPRMYKHTGHEAADPVSFIPNDKYPQQQRDIVEFFQMAQAYANRKSPLEYDLRYEALRGIFTGDKRLYVHADFIKEIREACQFKQDFGIQKMSIVGGYDSWMASDLLRENNISVLVRRVNSLPRFAEDPIDAPYGLAAKLAEAGVEFCFEMSGDMETMQNRNLSFNVGTAIAHGLSKGKALEALTVVPARILGIEEHTGSLVPGKEANFIIVQGDVFDMRKALVEAVYFRGNSLNIDNRQEQLYRKFAEKLGIE